MAGVSVRAGSVGEALRSLWDWLLEYAIPLAVVILGFALARGIGAISYPAALFGVVDKGETLLIAVVATESVMAILLPVLAPLSDAGLLPRAVSLGASLRDPFYAVIDWLSSKLSGFALRLRKAKTLPKLVALLIEFVVALVGFVARLSINPRAIRRVGRAFSLGFEAGSRPWSPLRSAAP